MQRICVLGATGSVGCSTLDVIRRNAGRFEVVALTAASRVEALAKQCLEFSPRFAVIPDHDGAARLKQLLDEAGCRTEVLSGEQALCDIAAHEEVDTVMAAIVGAAGLLPTLAAVKAGKRVLLANKEALVMSGQLFIDAVAQSGALLLPIDSEHNAIFQCLPPRVQRGDAGLEEQGITRVLLTGSGGPFRTLPLSQLPRVTPEQAVAHPNWSMGRKISVDSATMMNKGLEFIEARWLFSAAPEQIQVVIHPQSVIHSMVQYADGSVLAQLGNPDMRTPIAHALAWPERITAGVEPLDFFQVADFSFSAPDYQRFPCLKLAMEACHSGQGACTVMNAANEVAVEAFLAGQIRFTEIADVCKHTLDQIGQVQATELEIILALDAQGRQTASQLVSRLTVD